MGTEVRKVAPCSVYKSQYFKAARTRDYFWVAHHKATNRYLHCWYWVDAMRIANRWAIDEPTNEWASQLVSGKIAEITHD